MSNTSVSEGVWVVIPAAGAGQRMQSDIPKQYLKIHNKTVLEHTLACFKNNQLIKGIVVALDADDAFWKQLDLNNSTSMPIYTVEGGNERSDSVLQALDYLTMVEKLPAEQWVLVHDAARPCLPSKDLDNLLLLINKKEVVGGLLASPVRDTMKRAKNNKLEIDRTESRNDLWHALTPQLFKLGQLKEAIEICREKMIEITDESSALESIGEHPVLVQGSHLNLKITYPEDIKIAETLLASGDSK